MLHRSGDNLESEAIKFIDEADHITIFSAYIKLNEIKKLNNDSKISQIIIRWEIRDLCLGVSSFEDLYQYCSEKNIALYRNTRIHLKAIWDQTNVILGSANVTNKGLGEAKGIHNFELNGLQKNISFADKQYFEKLINTSEYVDKNLFEKIKKIVEETPKGTDVYPDLPSPAPKKEKIDYFLINQLPSVESPEKFWNLHNSKEPIESEEENKLAHDLEVFNVSNNTEKESFLNNLQENFEKHPFIVEFKRAVIDSKDRYGREDRNGQMVFSQVRNWFSNNTTTVPTPIPYDLTEQVNILYSWISYFDKNFKVHQPGKKTRVISYIPKT